MLLAPETKAGGITKPFGPGDLLNLSELPIAISNAAGVTYTGAQVVAGQIFRQAIGAAQTDTLPTANQIIDALRGALNIPNPPNNALYGLTPNQVVNLAWPGNLMPIDPGSTFRLVVANQAANAFTMAVPASAGMAFAAAPFGTNVNVGASLWREYLFRILNSSPATVLSVGTTNASVNLSIGQESYDLLNQITVGMSVYGTGIAASTKVASVNRDIGRIVLDTAATATNNPVGISFTPTIEVVGLRSGTI